MNLIKRITTSEDQKYFDEEAKLLEAHYKGKLGKSWYRRNPKTGKMEIKPKSVFGRIS